VDKYWTIFVSFHNFLKDKKKCITTEGHNGYHRNIQITAENSTGTNSTPIIQTRASTYDYIHIQTKVPKMKHA
jgi:hypothetical protein